MRIPKNREKITLLDGGMGRELLKMGAPFRQPEWSALSLMNSPELVTKAHEAFGAAGSDILTTSNYAVVPFHIGRERFFNEGALLTALSGRLARQAADSFGCRVAGSIPPLFGSYRPDLFDPKEGPELLAIVTGALKPYVDIWLGETVSSIEEARAIAAALNEEDRPLWISFTLMDCLQDSSGQPCLRSQESVADGVQCVLNLGAEAVLFNCSRPEVMDGAIDSAQQVIKETGKELLVGVYANGFPSIEKEALANSSLHELRRDLDPKGYLSFAESWRRRGASIIGGCCGIGPEHIAALKKHLT